VSIKNKKLIR